MAYHYLARKNKYGNHVCYADGKKFDSQHERGYYYYLKDLEKQGKISNLRLQVAYELVPAVTETVVKHFVRKPDEVRVVTVQPAVNYIADFVYVDNSTGREEVVDAKSVATQKDKVYILKKKMMRAFKGITIVEV